MKKITLIITILIMSSIYFYNSTTVYALKDEIQSTIKDTAEKAKKLEKEKEI